MESLIKIRNLENDDVYFIDRPPTWVWFQAYLFLGITDYMLNDLRILIKLFITIGKIRRVTLE